jgi:thiol:disulfide interchange protein
MAARCAECLNEAIERCEVTGVPLCAGCLWYTDDGRRVSERAAKQLSQQGISVYSPATYLNQLGTAAELPRLPEAPPLNTKHRNGNDLIALLAGISGIISIATCFGVGIALCVPPLPLLPLLLGSIGLAGSRAASNPSQARLLSWIGVAGGVGFVALVLLLIVGSIAFGTTTMLTSVFTPRVLPTPLPTPGP